MVVEREHRFPNAVANELRRRRPVMLSGATARVLDLSDPAARELVREVIDGESTAVDSKWDLAVSTAELIRFPDLPAALGAIDQLLSSRGRLVAFEPVARPGTARVLAAAPWSSTKWVRGFHVGRDLVAAVRTTTLIADDIDRLTIPTAVLPLRQFVLLTARRVGQNTEVVT